jgi:hypothetical protein
MMARAQRSRLEKSLVGPAGEHYVLYQLYRHALLSSLAPPGTPEVDVLVLSTDGESVAAAIQVKTRTYGTDGGWHMNVKHESIESPRMFYAFVDLEPDHPSTFVVPSTRVAAVLRTAHRAWLDTPGRNGKPHRDHDMRRVLPSYPFAVANCEPGWLDEYRECWQALTDRVS